MERYFLVHLSTNETQVCECKHGCTQVCLIHISLRTEKGKCPQNSQVHQLKTVPSTEGGMNDQVLWYSKG